MGYVSFGTRKATGRRYSIDPALQFEAERLQNEYSLAPGREARALQESQFQRGLDVQENANKQQFYSGMIGTAGNVGLTLAIGRQAGWWGGKSAVPSVTGATGAGTTGAGFTGGIGTATAPTFGVGATAPTFGSYAGLKPFEINPSLYGAEGAGGATGAGASTGMSGAAATPSIMAPYTTAAGQVAGPAGVAGFVGGKLGQPIGEFIGLGGKAERGTVGGALAGAATGGAIAGPPGAAAGAVIGAVVGLASNTWICTAANRWVGLSKPEKASMKKLRRYSKENHPGWLEFYNQNGPELIYAIEDAETDITGFYENVKNDLVQPSVRLVDEGKLEEAFNHYKEKTTELFNEYTPEIIIVEVL